MLIIRSLCNLFPCFMQETLIVWTEDDSCDLALSFQEKAGCDDIWSKICEVKKHGTETVVGCVCKDKTVRCPSCVLQP